MAGLERQPMRILFFEFSILPLGGGLIGFLLTTTATTLDVNRVQIGP